MGDCALHTVIGLNSRRRKGLEPSRRLSETTGPQSPSAFLVVFPAPEVTKRGARCKRAAALFTHRAPATATVLALIHPLPPRTGSRRTCSRTAAARRAHVPAAQGRAAQTVPQAEVFALVRTVVRRAMRSRMPTKLAAASAHVLAPPRTRVQGMVCEPVDGAAVEGERGEGDDERGAERRREDDSEPKLVEEVKRRLR